MDCCRASAWYGLWTDGSGQWVFGANEAEELRETIRKTQGDAKR
jgi:hypothetical protein